ncbi:MAG: acyl-CoA dehydratase activase [Deltaproteobacteria bacterium]|nr:acyl-CoA dehydratase activase [Deltaproteobacteria bacterium]
MTKNFLGIDCGSVSLNLFLMNEDSDEPVTIYLRARGRPLQTFVEAIGQMVDTCGGDLQLGGALVTGSARELLSKALEIPAINEISAHAVGAYKVNPAIRTIIEIGGQDSKYIRIEPSPDNGIPRVPVFRMNEICAAGTGAFLDEQADRLDIGIESFGSIALQSSKPASIAGRCAVFAKTDMIHQAQEGTPLPDILLGLAFALVRNYTATLIKGDSPEAVLSLQGGVMSNQAVVHAFREELQLEPEQIVIPPHFKVLGALGCAEFAARRASTRVLSLGQLKSMAERAMKKPPARSFLQPLKRTEGDKSPEIVSERRTELWQPPLVMGLDVGSVSVKGVIIDSLGKILREDYRLSRSRPLEAVTEVLESLLLNGIVPDVISVTGSGRNLAGRLLDSELIVNEISAQARAALNYDASVDTVVEIGGQDSKWIAFENGQMIDFEMNRVCAAGTGSFLMAQAQRLDLSMGPVFSEAAFAARTPADLGTRCTVFMESDLIHHQNNGASSNDLAAGVCISIVQNYLERVAHHKSLGDKVLFLGGVAATPAVKAAFEEYTGHKFYIPTFFRVSGALGAALIALDKIKHGEIAPNGRKEICWNPEEIQRDQFDCNGCTNQCKVNKYKTDGRIIFHGGLCDRWESEDQQHKRPPESNVFSFRTELLERSSERDSPSDTRWAMVRSPQFYDYFPFWQAFLLELGISLVVAPRSDRRQFEDGSRSLRVETCMPMKVMAGQIRNVINSGARTLFHPSILSDPPLKDGEQPLEYCPYIQASSIFFKGVFDIEWIEPTVNSKIDPNSFQREHIRFATDLGFSHGIATAAFERGLAELKAFNAEIRRQGEQFLNSLCDGDQALVVLGKPYHTADTFLNMNLGSLLQKLGIRAMPGDLYPTVSQRLSPVTWKYQARMIQVAHEIARDPRLFPVFIGFFGCGQDAFTLRHIRDALSPKPLLVLEMDEHSSRTGVITRIEAFWDRVRLERSRRQSYVPLSSAQPAALTTAENKTIRRPKADLIYLPYWGDHSHAFSAAARSVGIDSLVLPPPDHESESLGRPHIVGGECHPYTLVLGDYLKLAKTVIGPSVSRSRFYILGPDACRLGQFPVYIDKIREQLGLSLGVIKNVQEGLAEFRISKRNYQRMLLRLWEGLNTYDLLFRLLLQIRPRVRDQSAVDRLYEDCRNKLYNTLSAGRVREGLEEVLHDLYSFPTDDAEPRPVIAVTGDYYTRVVPFANNDAFREIEANGGCILAPPTLSDCFKMGTLRDFVWSLLSGQSREAARHGLLYTLMTILELNVRCSRTVRHLINGPLDLMGIGMWRTATNHAHTKLPAGITAPIATTLKDLEVGADGVLNLMTLNCSYGTVVTAALIRALKARPEIPMLTLVYDGLKKTNEKTRIEAFMAQAHDHFERRLKRENEPSIGTAFLRRLMAR